MRVISGKARGRKLKQVPGDSTRPVRDIVKESLFNILGTWVRGTRWLDMFAGTGSVGIEALSRDAAFCLFLDNNRRAIRTIHDNLDTTGLRADAEVRQVDALAFIGGSPQSDDQMFEVIYIAPPQYKDMWRKALVLVDSNPAWLVEDGIVIVQIDPVEFADVELANLVLYEERKYGSTLLCFYELADDQ